MENSKKTCNCPKCGTPSYIIYVDSNLGDVYKCQCSNMWYFDPEKYTNHKRNNIDENDMGI